jgi:tetratricopeptide (TPR) repeat protein
LSRLRILNLLLLFLFWSSALVAQKSTCSFSFPVHFTFGYLEKESSFSGISNEMITVIAEDAIKNPHRISFTLNTDMQIRIVTPEGRNPMVGISFGPQKLSGNIRFRKFSMASVMMPDRIAFGCRFEKKDSSSFFDIPEAIDLKFAENDSTLLQCQIPHFSCDSDTVVVYRLRFYFDEDALARFRERVTLINDYYAANAVLDSLERKVREIDLGEINRYPGYFIILEELNKVLVILQEKNFLQHLELDSLDPVGFQEKYMRLSRFSFSATMTFRENVKTPGIPNSAFSPDSLIRQFLDGMCSYIRWSMLVTERNSGIYHEFLERYFRLNAFGDDHEVIRNLVGKMFPGRDIDSTLAIISGKINKAYHDRADKLMKNQQYAEAVELLGNAHNFNEVNPYLKGSVNDREIITKAANGIYNSYLGVADGAIRYGKQEMARSYMIRAQNYRKEHAAFVTSDSLFNRVFGEVVTETLSRCDTLFTSSRYPEALECYRDFEKGFDSLTLSLIQRGLEPKIQFCRYKILIREGEKNLAKIDKPEAGRIFFLARQLSEDENFSPDSLLDSLCNVIYPFYLIHLLNSGEYRIWTNRLELARRFADSIAFIQRTTGVESSRELSDALAGYRRKVEERTCWNANEAVEVFFLRAQHEREIKDFIVAGSLTDSAVSLIRQNPDCLIPFTGMKDTTDKYQEALEFQRRLRRVEVCVTAGRFKDAVTGYIELEDYNRAHDIGRFGFPILPMFDYIRNRSIQELTLQAFLYFEGKPYPEQAYRYLKLLRLQDYPRKDARPFLEGLGKEYAGKDFRDQPDKEPVDLVRSYTGRDQWMKRFRFAYYSEAQHLRHKPGLRYLFRKFFP